MKIPGWKDADSNWEIGGGLTSSLDKTSSKWFDESRKQRGGRNSLRAMEQQIVGCQKLYFLRAPPRPIDSKTLIPPVRISVSHQRVSSRPITRWK